MFMCCAAYGSSSVFGAGVTSTPGISVTGDSVPIVRFSVFGS